MLANGIKQGCQKQGCQKFVKKDDNLIKVVLGTNANEYIQFEDSCSDPNLVRDLQQWILHQYAEFTPCLSTSICPAGNLCFGFPGYHYSSSCPSYWKIHVGEFNPFLAYNPFLWMWLKPASSLKPLFILFGFCLCFAFSSFGS